MKLANYEKKSIVSFSILLFLVGVLGLFIFTVSYKMPSYYLITGVVCKEDLIEVMVSDKELKQLYRSNFTYIDDKKYEYHIREVVREAIVKNKENYHIAYIECSIHDEKENDIIDFSFQEKRVPLFRIFDVVWR